MNPASQVAEEEWKVQEPPVLNRQPGREARRVRWLPVPPPLSRSTRCLARLRTDSPTERYSGLFVALL